MFFFVLLAGSIPAYAQEKVINLNFSNFFPASHKNSIIMADWCKEVEKRTKGRVKLTYYPGAGLTPAGQTYDSVVKGIADVGESVLGYTKGRFPLTEVIDLPLGYKNAYVATKMINAYFKKFQPKEFDQVKVMYLHAHGPGILFTKRPVKNLEELKGMKVRSTGFSAKVAAAPGGLSRCDAPDGVLRGAPDRYRRGHPEPHRGDEGLEDRRGGQVHHRELRLRIQHVLFRRHEQEQVELSPA
jgi:TRAP-type C4-dicarboxylate transport system substrate-binding protein